MKSIVNATCVSLLLAAAVVYGPGSFAAGPWSWATESALARFTKSDLALLNEAISEALNSAEENYTASWSNPETGHGGSVSVSPRRQVDSMSCRDTLLEHSAASVQGTSSYLLCEQPDGSWQITYPSGSGD